MTMPPKPTPLETVRSDLVHSLVGTLILAAVSTFGDWLWTHYIPDGAVIPGVVHGAVVFLVIAGVLAWSAGSRRAAKILLPSLPGAGMVIAAVFYPLATQVGYLAALVITWMMMWLATAVLQRWAGGNRETFGRAILRGLVAALASGLAFWAISGIWTSPSPEGPNYLWHFACWAFAFLPGFLALLLGQSRRVVETTR